MDIEKVATEIVDAAIKVHKTLGTGLLEWAYQRCLEFELTKRKIKVICEVTLPILYDGLEVDAGYRLDMLIEDCIIVENKAIDKLLPIHDAQLLTYMKLKRCKIGFLINWNVKLLKDGINRRIL